MTEPGLTTGGPAPRSVPVALLVAVRPKQWVKNLLVFAAPGAAGMIHHAGVVEHTVGALACFCLVSAGTYLVNDAGDAASDRLHPTKRHRPVARGEVSTRLAYALGALLMAGGVALGFAVRWQLAIVLVSYLLLTTSYSLYLKHVAVVDIVAVAAGFVLRAVAGGAATNIPISDWFFIITSFGSLFMVVGKRHSESVTMADDRGATRATLATYTPSFLSYLRTVASGVVLVAYCLWAFEKAKLVDTRVPWFEISILPFTCGLLRYAQLIDLGEAGAPEEVVFRDRAIQVIGAVWVLVFAIGVYSS